MTLVTFGEGLIRLSPPQAGRLPQSGSLDLHVGGSELNVAVGAAHLGVTSRWVSRLPDNPLGRLIAARAGDQGVDLSLLQWTSDGRVGLYFAEVGGITLYDRAGSAMSRVTPGSFDWQGALAGARWFHVSGITPALSDAAAAATAEALAAAKAASVTVSYDLNYRPKLWSADRARQVQEPLLAHVDVLIANQDDPGLLFGIDIGRGPEAVARALQKRFGCPAVAVTLRESTGNDPSKLRKARGAMLLVEGTVHHAPRVEMDVVDPIGAGDAFDAGLIAARLLEKSWDAALRWGVASSALKLAVAGDFGHATPADIDRLLINDTLQGTR